jgi:hypothetical protein
VSSFIPKRVLKKPTATVKKASKGLRAGNPIAALTENERDQIKCLKEKLAERKAALKKAAPLAKKATKKASPKMTAQGAQRLAT